MNFPTTGPLISRRLFLAGGAAVSTLLLTGCGLFGSSAPRTVTQTAPPPVDPMAALIAMTRLHTARLQSAVALGQPVLGDKLPLVTALHTDRQAHLATLEADAARVVGSSAAASTATALPAVSVGADVTAALAVIADDAGTAQVAFLDQVPLVGRYRAAMFASIAACLATHRAVLG